MRRSNLRFPKQPAARFVRPGAQLAHGRGIMDLASAVPVRQPASVSHDALAHWKVSVTGERHG
jgi:hypothetical protein